MKVPDVGAPPVVPPTNRAPAVAPVRPVTLTSDATTSSDAAAAGAAPTTGTATHAAPTAATPASALRLDTGRRLALPATQAGPSSSTSLGGSVGGAAVSAACAFTPIGALTRVAAPL